MSRSTRTAHTQRTEPTDEARSTKLDEKSTGWGDSYAKPKSNVPPCQMGAELPQASMTTPLGEGTLFLSGPDVADASGTFQLIVHLHGERAVQREVIASRQPFALYTITLPPNESYGPLFAGTGLLRHLLPAIEQRTSEQLGRSVKMGHLILSAWSAGFVGVRSILYQPESKLVDAFVLADGLHAPKGGMPSYLERFVSLARRASQGKTWFFMSHSSIPTVSFTSTTESAHYLLRRLGYKSVPVKDESKGPLVLTERLDVGKFRMRGYQGTKKSDHCAQLLVLRQVFSELGSRWASD